MQLNLHDESDVRRAWHAIRTSVSEQAGPEHFQGVTVQPMVKLEGYELILGSSIDPQFGPVLLFGAGGQLVEVFQDRALALPPLNTTLARRMMEQTRIFKALTGVRGRKPVNLAALEELLVRFSQLVVEQRWIKEIDVNPLLASPERLLALDARVVVHGPEMSEDLLPHSAVRPYPAQYVADWTMKSGQQVTIRPIRPEDEPLMVQFHQTLSERSVYLRYFNALKLSQRIAHDRLMRICFIDYDREMALVAVRTDPDDRCPGDPWRRTAEPPARDQRSRVRSAGGRSVATAGTGHGTAAQNVRDRPPGKDCARGGKLPGRELRDAERLQKARDEAGARHGRGAGKGVR